MQFFSRYWKKASASQRLSLGSVSFSLPPFFNPPSGRKLFKDTPASSLVLPDNGSGHRRLPPVRYFYQRSSRSFCFQVKWVIITVSGRDGQKCFQCPVRELPVYKITVFLRVFIVLSLPPLYFFFYAFISTLFIQVKFARKMKFITMK